ncbi:type II glyceraldehyde-3-phosphate dehydrogenase [Pseudomonas aeruginosa]|nr:type II glyceraldehyde-3-phosphate dehydrogenase [Pseudomonas aeruginosa]
MNKVRVAVNGYGVIGKRVADAVALQEDMALAGVADVVHDYRLQVAAQRAFPIYAATAEAAQSMRAAGLPVAGDLADLLANADVVVDCTPKKVAAVNKRAYDAAGVKSIFHGGESHALTGHSFVAQENYATAIGRTSTRVVSCNTTSIVRTLGALPDSGPAQASPRDADPPGFRPVGGACGGHHQHALAGEDDPQPSGTGRAHCDPGPGRRHDRGQGTAQQQPPAHLVGRTTRPATRDEVLAAFRAAPRIAFVRSSDGLVALNSTVELMADLGRPRGDLWEVALWEDVLSVDGDQAYYTYQVFNQAIVIPETIDAIRALSGIETDPQVSMARTDASLGLQRDFIRDRVQVRR